MALGVGEARVLQQLLQVGEALQRALCGGIGRAHVHRRGALAQVGQVHAQAGREGVLITHQQVALGGDGAVGVRAPLGISDRACSAASQLQPHEYDWDALFGRDGARWLHTGGIFAALSEQTR